jgi:hypothetical protein
VPFFSATGYYFPLGAINKRIYALLVEIECLSFLVRQAFYVMEVDATV